MDSISVGLTNRATDQKAVDGRYTTRLLLCLITEVELVWTVLYAFSKARKKKFERKLQMHSSFFIRRQKAAQSHEMIHLPHHIHISLVDLIWDDKSSKN